jgi:hypothetical protein
MPPANPSWRPTWGTHYDHNSANKEQTLRSRSRILLFALVAVALASGVILAVRRGVSRATELHCQNNLRQIGLALANYHDTYLAFPPARDGGHSWRIRALPFMWASPQYSAYDFDQPWNAENNITIDTRPLPSKDGELVVMGNPYGPPCDRDDPHATSYLAIVGQQAFANPDAARKPSDILDGLENTIAVAEVAGSNVHWLSPVDLEFESMSFVINVGPHSISSHHPSGPAVLFGDGAVYRINPAIDPEIVRAMCTIDGGEPISRDSLVAKGLLIP